MSRAARLLVLTAFIVGDAREARAQSALPVKYAGKTTTPAISVADLMSRLYISADDSMMGRRAGSLRRE